MASGLTSKEDSDRLIRDLMKKTKDLEKQMGVMKQAHADGSNALKEALADRAAMADQLGQIQCERDSLDTKYQALKSKHAKLKDKATALKGTIQEFESVLQKERTQFRELEETFEEHQSQARRRERQLSNDLILVTQERDGYSEQLVSLRDKISLLSRELADGEKGGLQQVQRIEELEAQLKAAKAAADASEASHLQRISELEASMADTVSELDKTTRSLKQELARVTQDRDGYKGQVETLRDKVSLLSRDLTDHQDSTTAKSDRILSLEQELQRAEAALASHQSKLAETEGELHSSRSEIAHQHAKLQALQDELEETKNAHARSEKSWLNEKQILCQDRDGFKSQVDSLRDKVSSLSRQLAENSESQDRQASEAATLRKQIDSMKEEHSDRLGELQASLDSTKDTLKQRSDDLEAAEAESKRQAAAWRAERAQLVSDRDGYKGQVETLRDKVSALSRDLTDASDQSGERVAELKSQLQSTAQELEDARQNLTQLQNKNERADETISQLNKKLEEERQKYVEEMSAAHTSHAQAVALWDKERGQLRKEYDDQTSRFAEAETSLAELHTALEAAKADSQESLLKLQQEISSLKDAAAHDSDSLRDLASQLEKAKNEHAAVSEELASQQSAATKDRKAWKAERALLVNERDGALSQVETLRDKVSTLSRELATSKDDGSGSMPSATSRPSQSGMGSSATDASVAHEMQELRRELCDAQAALAEQMPMVEQLQAELVDLQTRAKETGPGAEAAQEAQEALYAAQTRNEQMQQELADVKKELEGALKARSSEGSSHDSAQLDSIRKSARDIVVSIAQTLRQPEPSSSGSGYSSGHHASVGDVMSSMNAACTIALSAAHAWDIERASLEAKVLDAAATGAINATRDAQLEKAAMKQELMKLQGQIELLEQREVELSAAQDRAKVQVAALTVELKSTASEVERASASAESVAAAAAEVESSRRQSVEDLHDRLKSSEGIIQHLSGQLRDEAEAHAEHLAELERQTSAERKQWRVERAQLINERDGFCGQVEMLRDKIGELSRELADLRRCSKSCSGEPHSSSPEAQDAGNIDNMIPATLDFPQQVGNTADHSHWMPSASNGASGELKVHPEFSGKGFSSSLGNLDLAKSADPSSWQLT